MKEARGLFITIESLSQKHRAQFITGLRAAIEKLGVGAEEIVVLPATQASSFSGYLNAAKQYAFYQKAPVVSKYMLDLAIHEEVIHTVVNPLLNKGSVVICDTFHDLTHAIFVHGHQKQPAGNHNGQLFAGQEFPSLQPDLTFVLDIEPLQALESTLSDESDRFSDSATLEFLVRTRSGFIKRADGFPDRIKLLDASQPITDIIEQATAIVQNSIGRSS